VLALMGCCLCLGRCVRLGPCLGLGSRLWWGRVHLRGTLSAEALLPSEQPLYKGSGQHTDDSTCTVQYITVLYSCTVLQCTVCASLFCTIEVYHTQYSTKCIPPQARTPQVPVPRPLFLRHARPQGRQRGSLPRSPCCFPPFARRTRGAEEGWKAPRGRGPRRAKRKRR